MKAIVTEVWVAPDWLNPVGAESCGAAEAGPLEIANWNIPIVKAKSRILVLVATNRVAEFD